MSVSWSLARISQVPIFTNSLLPATRTSISPCPSALVVRVPKPTWRNTSPNLPTVSPFFPVSYAHTEVLFPGSLEQLIQHGLHALRETLQQDKELTINNTSVGILGASGEKERNVKADGSFRIIEGAPLAVYLQSMQAKDVPEPPPAAAPAAEPTTAPTEPAAPAGEDVQMGDA